MWNHAHFKGKEIEVKKGRIIAGLDVPISNWGEVPNSVRRIRSYKLILLFIRFPFKRNIPVGLVMIEALFAALEVFPQVL